VATVDLRVAKSTEGDQVPFVIASCVAAKVDMVDLKASTCTTNLASPAVALEHGLVQVAIGISVDA
jgi:hypothetical protein